MQVRKIMIIIIKRNSYKFKYCLFYRSVSSPVHSILVNDGSICGESSFCQNNTCIEQKQKRPCDPQKTCSGNGVSSLKYLK